MKKINKYVSVLSVLTLTLFLTACGDSGNGSSAAGANKTALPLSQALTRTMLPMKAIRRIPTTPEMLPQIMSPLRI